MMNKITFTRQEKKFLKTHFSEEFLERCADALESSISRIVKAYNNMDWGFNYQNMTNGEREINITYTFNYNCREQVDFVNVAIDIDNYIYIDLIKNKRINNKYALYEVTAEVCDFMREELNYENNKK